MAKHRNSTAKYTLILRLYRTFFRMAGFVAPKSTADYAYYIWFTTHRFKRPVVEEHKLEQSVNTYHNIGNNKIFCSLWGEQGPLVLLVHGWNGRGTQLHHFIEPMLQQGFRVLCFDAPGHGRSDAKKTDIFEIAHIIGELPTLYGDLHAIVAHSFGGPSSLLALNNNLKVARLVCISPPASLMGLFEAFAKIMSINDKVMSYMNERVVMQYGADVWDRVSLFHNTRNLSMPSLILHDKDDRDVPVASSRAVVVNWPNSRYIETQGLGHRRILKSEQVIQQVVQFIG